MIFNLFVAIINEEIRYYIQVEIVAAYILAA